MGQHRMLWQARCRLACDRSAQNTASPDCAHTGSDWIAAFSTGNATSAATRAVRART